MLSEVILLAGKAQVGKTTLANKIREKNKEKTIIISFSDAIKVQAEEALGYGKKLEMSYDDLKKKHSTRVFMQALGDLTKELYGEDFYVKKVRNKLDGIIRSTFPQKTVVIDDLRFDLEYAGIAAWCKDNNISCLVLNLERNFESKLSEKERSHKSESGLSFIINRVEVPNGTDYEVDELISNCKYLWSE